MNLHYTALTIERLRNTAPVDRLNNPDLVAREEEDRTVEAAADFLESMKKEIPKSAKGEKQWFSTIKKLEATISHGEPRVTMQGSLRVTTPGQTRVDGTVTTSNSPACPRTLRAQPRIHQRKTRRNIHSGDGAHSNGTCAAW